MKFVSVMRRWTLKISSKSVQSFLNIYTHIHTRTSKHDRPHYLLSFRGEQPMTTSNPNALSGYETICSSLCFSALSAFKRSMEKKIMSEFCAVEQPADEFAVLFYSLWTVFSALSGLTVQPRLTYM